MFMNRQDLNIDEHTDFEEINIDLIIRVFTKCGQTMSMQEAMGKLMDIMKNDPQKSKKAAGALGGAVKNKFLVRNGENFTRVR